MQAKCDNVNFSLLTVLLYTILRGTVHAVQDSQSFTGQQKQRLSPAKTWLC